MNETVFVLTKYEVQLIGVAVLALAVGGFVGWVKGFGDGLVSADKEKGDGI